MCIQIIDRYTVTVRDAWSPTRYCITYWCDRVWKLWLSRQWNRPSAWNSCIMPSMLIRSVEAWKQSTISRLRCHAKTAFITTSLMPCLVFIRVTCPFDTLVTILFQPSSSSVSYSKSSALRRCVLYNDQVYEIDLRHSKNLVSFPHYWLNCSSFNLVATTASLTYNNNIPTSFSYTTVFSTNNILFSFRQRFDSTKYLGDHWRPTPFPDRHIPFPKSWNRTPAPSFSFATWSTDDTTLLHGSRSCPLVCSPDPFTSTFHSRYLTGIYFMPESVGAYFVQHLVREAIPTEREDHRPA